jgi:hypothetical protein
MNNHQKLLVILANSLERYSALVLGSLFDPIERGGP